MKLYFPIIYFILILVGCSFKENSQNNVDKKVVAVINDTDRTNIKGKIEKQEAKVMQMDIIDEMDSIYYSRIKHYKNSLLKSVNLNKIPYLEPRRKGKVKLPSHMQSTSRFEVFEDISKSLKEALAEGDFDSLRDLYYKEITYYRSFNMAPYFLYMGEKHNIFGAYMEIYYYYYSLNFDRRKDLHLAIVKETKLKEAELEYLTTQERDLAICSLITAYKKGDFSAAFSLSLYFKEGLLLFPQDIAVSRRLDSIYDIRHDSSYWNDSIYVP